MFQLADSSPKHTDCADDAGAPEVARRFVLGVQVGEPFCARLAELLVY